MTLRFDGKVVLITGAGNGLGKEYALAFGDRGAKVIVNDLGGNIKGEGKSSKPADLVVDQIKSKGGFAIANYDSVENGENLVKCALDNFGKIDIIVNNAGILRDKTIARMTDEDWDLVHKIHLRSVFQITRAAWPHMKNQNFGRIITISSASGIYGNFGQANYSAAKLGVFGLTQTLAIEGQKDNIFVNSVAPIAGSRMTRHVMPEDLVKALKPEYVAPLVLWLAHQDCTENGSIFECGAGWAGKLRWERTKGAYVRKSNQPMVPEDIQDKWDKIICFKDSDHPKDFNEANSSYFKVLQELSEKDANYQSSLISESESKFSYNFRDVILYALSIGASTSEVDHLRFLYENSKYFSIFPTYSVIAALDASTNAISSHHFKDFEFNPAMILHGEQYTEILRPLKGKDILTSRAQIIDVLDKGSGATIIVNVDTTNSFNEKVAFNQIVIFLQGAGNFGGKRTSDKIINLNSEPSTPPIKSVISLTTKDQAALYRLNGDFNPLHIDPSFAALGGFDQPILHGLCSYGIVTREIIKEFCDNKIENFKAIKARFMSPVLPGQSLRTDMWKTSQRIHFICKVVETDKICLRGFVDVHDDVKTSNASTSSSYTHASHSKIHLLSDKIFRDMINRLKSKQSLGQTIDAIFSVNIIKDGQHATEWTISLKKDCCEVYEGKSKTKADCILTISDEDFEELASGKLNGMQLFQTGRLKLTGNVMLSAKLGALFQEQSKL